LKKYFSDHGKHVPYPSGKRRHQGGCWKVDPIYNE